MSISARAPDSVENNWAESVYRIAISSLIGLSFFYTLAFDYLPGQIRLMFAGVIAAGYIGLAFERVLFSRDPAIRWMFTGVALIVFAWAAGDLINPFDPERAGASVATGFRNISGLFSGIVILGYADRINPRFVLFGFIALIGTAGAVALTQAGINLAGTARLHPFTGGSGLHSSAFVVALAMLGVFHLWRTWHISTVIAVPVLLLGSYVLLGYAVRTALVLLLIAALVTVFQAMTKRIRYLAPILISFGIAGVFLSLLFLASLMDGGTWKDLVSFSSGRLATYSERLDTLAQRDILGQLFGSGPGSDLGFSRQWFWEAKVSHNDFIQHFKEDGTIGVFGIVIYIIGIFKFARFDGLPYTLCLVGTSAISAALLARPTVITFFFLALALLVTSRPSTRRVITSPGPSRNIRPGLLRPDVVRTETSSGVEI